MRLPSLPKLPRWWKKAAVGLGVVGVVALVARGRGVKIPTLYWQGAQPWGAERLGNGSLSFGDAGCLETCTTMASDALAGTGFDPSDVNDIVKAAGGFSGSLLILEVAAAAVGLTAPDGERVHSGTGAQADELRSTIDYALQNGGVCAVNVDHSASGPGQHWVLVHDVSGDAYVAADPALAQEITIDRQSLIASSAWNGNPVVVGAAPIYRA
ncbi:MAG TPA: hypothetical protein VGO62_09555 [Myxococcota bacterium]|jgi:hypothetical protein